MKKSIDVKEIYHSCYFLTKVDGYKEFVNFDGTFATLFSRYQRNLVLLDLLPHQSLLEIGCGRGEICIYHALNGGQARGVDFSGAAIVLAREKADALKASVEFIESSFDELNVENERYDRILASEFIEHISAEECDKFFLSAFALLKPGGKLLVFTMPNIIQRRYGYPLQRFLALLSGKILPLQQSDTLSEHYKLYHLNEQSYFTLKSCVKNIGFRKVKVDYDYMDCMNQAKWKRALLKVLSLSPFRHLFFNNLFLLAEK